MRRPLYISIFIILSILLLVSCVKGKRIELIKDTIKVGGVITDLDFKLIEYQKVGYTCTRDSLESLNKIIHEFEPLKFHYDSLILQENIYYLKLDKENSIQDSIISERRKKLQPQFDKLSKKEKEIQQKINSLPEVKSNPSYTFMRSSQWSPEYKNLHSKLIEVGGQRIGMNNKILEDAYNEDSVYKFSKDRCSIFADSIDLLTDSLDMIKALLRDNEIGLHIGWDGSFSYYDDYILNRNTFQESINKNGNRKYSVYKCAFSIQNPYLKLRQKYIYYYIFNPGNKSIKHIYEYFNDGKAVGEVYGLDF